MKKLLLVFLLLLQSVILPQNNFIQQITSGDFDARNPFIYKDEYGFYDNSIFFELHKNGFVNLYYLKYNSNNASFNDTVALTTGNYQNINPTYHPSLGILYQTNQYGNWDIAFVPDSSGILGNPKFLTSSSADEVNPTFFELSEDYFPYFQDSTNILFKRNGDIISLTYKHNQISEDVVFNSDSEFIYHGFVGLESTQWGSDQGFYVFAIEENIFGHKKIVRRFKPFNNNWQDKVILKDNCDCSGLYLQYSNYSDWGLFYRDTLQAQKRYFVIENPASPNAQTFYLELQHSGNLSSLEIYYFLIVTKDIEAKIKEPELYFPYTYLVEDNGITKVRFDISDLGIWDRDSLVQVSLQNSNVAVGGMGVHNNYLLVYTVWEDSIDGRIQLFGTTSHIAFGAVENESYANDFVLFQNYPNPFNPSTKIEYKLLQVSDVKFNVFNILGEKVFEQDFGYQTAGSYKINFDGKNLPSGVYIYSIYTNENRLSRKMMLMK